MRGQGLGVASVPRHLQARLPRSWLADVRQDLRFALRQAIRSPGATSLVVATLAVGFGANTVMAGVIDRLLLRPPAHVEDPPRVARLVFAGPDPGGGTSFGTSSNYTTLLDLQREVAGFAATAGYSRVELSLGRGRDAVEVRASLVSPGYFDLLRPRPVRGRAFGAADGFPRGEAAGGPAVAVLSHGFWQRQFGGDAAILGRDIRVGSVSYTVVGVTPNGFRGVEGAPPDVWLPITVAGPADAPALWFAGRGATWLSLVARLEPGVHRKAAEQQATVEWRRHNALRGTRDTLIRVVLAPPARGAGPDAPRAAKVALWLGGVSVLVLGIACVNVTSLLLGRALVRRGELAVRIALGAARARLARQMLAEAGLVAALGVAVAVGVTWAGGEAVTRLLVNDLGVASSGAFLDGRLVAWTAAISVATALTVGLAPLAHTASPGLTNALRTGAFIGTLRVSRARTGLLAVQAALSTVLSVGALLFALSLRRVEGLDLGLDVGRTLVARFDLDGLALPATQIDAIYAEMRARVRAIPGVERAALVERDPYRGGRAVSAHTPARSADELWHENVAEIPMEAAVDSGFFRTVGARTLRGRDFESTDRRGAPRVAIVNEPLARILWPGEDALGRCVFLPARAGQQNGECVTVVGVLPGFWRRTILDRDQLLVYVPLAQRTVRFGRPGGLSSVCGATRLPARLPCVRRSRACGVTSPP